MPKGQNYLTSLDGPPQVLGDFQVVLCYARLASNRLG
jgi:hypothetical protein